jgi:hypothetical protein
MQAAVAWRMGAGMPEPRPHGAQQLQAGRPHAHVESYGGTSQGFRFGTAAERLEIIGTRNRAYQAYDNNPVARTLVQTETDHVIGDGLNFEPTSDSPEWNREAEDRYYAWLEECSVRGPDVEPGCEIQRNLWSYSRVAGHIGWILVSRGPESRIQTVRAENIARRITWRPTGRLTTGSATTPSAKPTAFYVLSQTTGRGLLSFTRSPPATSCGSRT